MSSDIGSDARKRKRNTIACFQCRTRKRRCNDDTHEICDNCLRDGLDCRRTSFDGRKLRWKRERMAGDDSSKPTQGQAPLLSDGSSREDAGDRLEIDDTFSNSLFDFILGYDGSRGGASSSTAPARLPSGLSGWTKDWTAEMASGQGTGGPSNTDSLSATTNDTSVTRYGADSTHQDRPLPLGAQPLSPDVGVQESSVKKVVWWRFHGPSAIAPGLKRITLKVRLDNQVDPPSPSLAIGAATQPNPSLSSLVNIIDDGGMPRYDLMLHLIDIFMSHFGCQYPALDRAQLEKDLEERTGSTLLFNCIASTASRFSKHPDIARPDLKPHAYGAIYLRTAKSLLGNMLAVPTRETVLALVMLSGASHGVDSESEEWMFAGMAVRMAVDLGLHLLPPASSSIPEDQRRLDRLAFWSVYFLDVSLSFGVGRETALRLESITQIFPTETDFVGTEPPTSNIGGPTVRHAFGFAARLAFAYGPLVNVVNGPRGDYIEWATESQRITQEAVEVYNALPQDMQWSAYNLQNLSRAHQGSIFVMMHLWMHTILASGYLIGTDVVRSERTPIIQGSSTPSNATATRLWQNSARTIGDILILTDIVDPFAYHALPFSNQPFVVAGCCYIKEADASQRAARDGMAVQTGSASKDERAEMYRSLLQSVTSNNITALREGLLRQSRYWAGVAWVAEVLAQRMSGVSMTDIDLNTVTEGLDSTVTIADARMFGPSRRNTIQSTALMPQLFDSTSAFFDLQLPLEADWLADTALLQSEGYPVTVEDFTSDWASKYNNG